MEVDIQTLSQIFRTNFERWFPYVHSAEARVPVAVHYAVGLSGEVGESLNLIKKALREGEVYRDGLDLELADCFIYLLLLADELGVDLVDASIRKVEINRERWG